MSRYLSILIIVCFFTSASAQYPVARKSFNNDWKFHLGDTTDVSASSFNDDTWTKLNLPHDWSIEMPFDKNSPTGTGGGALRGGLGWYRKTFKLPGGSKGKKVFIDFDGVYMNSEVFINGKSLGVRPNGYISFRYDLTPHIDFDRTNVIAVKVDNSKQPNSRWYSGSGIYRNVWLVVQDFVHVTQWGTYVTVSNISTQRATVNVQSIVENETAKQAGIKLHTVIYDSRGRLIGQQLSDETIPAGTKKTFATKIIISNPSIWSIDQPDMYRAFTTVWKDKEVLDEYATPFGVRDFRFDADKGFFLNGKHLKIRGVCMHHDLGCLGTSINYNALRRQLQILKEMGCNAIRTSHNPPAPELLDLCDRMGFIVMDEAFDMWAKEKTKYDYHLYWDQWYKRDLEDQLLRDRNHPSIFMWSVGNEIIEQWGKDTTGRTILRELVAITKQLDPTRPVVTANNEVNPWNNLLQANAEDIIGYNYNHLQWDSVHYRWGKKPFIVTESTSALQTRGHYDMPSDSIRLWPPRWDLPLEKGNPDITCSAYDNCQTPWGTTHEVSLREMEKLDHIAGMFVWTGFDYIGEPTPYPWPARSSYFGIVDLAGFPKDVYYMYQSAWTSKPVLHIFPHWNYASSQKVDIWAYYNNADEVELFINEKSQGIKRKQGDELHVMWRVNFEPGVLKAVSRKNGNIVLTKEIKTAGKPAAISISADKTAVLPDNRELVFITAKVVDENGNIVPDADNLIEFGVTGQGDLVATDNGSQTDLESFQSPKRKALNGMCLGVIRANGLPGTINVSVYSGKLKPASINIRIR